MKEKKRMLLVKISGAVFLALIILLWLGIVYIELQSGPLNPIFFVTVVPLVIIIAVLVLAVRRQSRAIKSGIPLKDERSSMIENKAGRYTVIATMWFLLAMGFYQMFMEELGLPEILMRHFIWIVFFVMLGLFVVFKLYFGRKGNI